MTALVESEKAGRVKLIVGLGNPGPKYSNTRHNAGFMVLNRLAERLGVSFREVRQTLLAEVEWEGERVVFLKPLTFMNRSGLAVARAAGEMVGEAHTDLLVVLDDVYLPVGKLRLRRGGSSGGHKGLDSIIECLGTEEIPRLRMGVGEDEEEEELADHVLGPFTQEEMVTVKGVVERAADAVLSFVRFGIDHAMNEFN
jgi:PTH1 family peptidyl-tRNA hydrolase